MVHPIYRIVKKGEPLPKVLTPVYSTISGIRQEYLRQKIKKVLQRIEIDDILPPPLWNPIAETFHLPSLLDAIRELHWPTADVDQKSLIARTSLAWKRVKLDELLAYQLSMARFRTGPYSYPAPAISLNEPFFFASTIATGLYHTLPFDLTSAQKRALVEITKDLSRTIPMHRLLQGDVGSGKTVVAALAAAQAIDAGYQVALMVPTELLAEQHTHKFREWLSRFDVRTVILTGSLSDKEKQEAISLISNGEAKLIIGTHALIQSVVKFKSLGLIIVDEQHRFGVVQRFALSQKLTYLGSMQPHQLMISATPIPRSLAMGYYGNLDVSTIDQLPPGRLPVLTKLVSSTRRTEIIEQVRKAVIDGRQVYWICPIIQPSNALKLTTTLDVWNILRDRFPELSVGLIHGRLMTIEKQQAIKSFAEGKTQILVTTTAIEVGIDVPNASLMVIDHAERFGLAQLHQLRGRIGRGKDLSVCILLYMPPLSRSACERLKVIYNSNDGFEIARKDLIIRGPGEFLGSKQSGIPTLRFASLDEDYILVEQSRKLAMALLKAYPNVANLHIDRWFGTNKKYSMI